MYGGCRRRLLGRLNAAGGVRGWLRRGVVAAAAIVGLGATLAALSGATSARPPASLDETPGPAATVMITATGEFDPQELTIRAGQTVRWQNASASPQTVTGDPGRALDARNVALAARIGPWGSGLLGPGARWSRQFEVIGDYVYCSAPCGVAGAVGRITVVE